VFQALPVIFIRTRHFSISNDGLVFIGIGIGSVLATVVNLFLTLACKFDLVPPEFLIIPTSSGLSDDPEPPRLLDSQHHSGSDDENDDRGRGAHHL
jgi:hypothetical protein